MSLRPILLLRPPLEALSAPGLWDELLEAGIGEVVVGELGLLQQASDGVPYPLEHTARPRILKHFDGRSARYKLAAPFRPSGELYKDTAYKPPDLPRELEPVAKELAAALASASEKGIRVYAFNADGGKYPSALGDPGCFNNPDWARYVVARALDYRSQYPRMAGIILDGPDYKWEILPNHRDDLFLRFCTCRHCQEHAASMGLDLLQIRKSLDNVRERLHRLTPQQVEGFLRTQQGIVNAVDWLLSEPAMLDLMRFRTSSVERFLKTVYEGIKAKMPDFEVGSGSRTPALAPLTGHNLRRKQSYSDFQLPKLYLWMGAVAGFRGTVFNYVKTLRDWNPGLPELLCVSLVEKLFGVRLTADYPPRQYERPAPRSFFKETVAGEIQKMTYLAGGPDKLAPWVGLEHFGSLWLTPGELRQLLETMTEQGLARYTYYVYHTITDEVWNIIKEFAKER